MIQQRKLYAEAEREIGGDLYAPVPATADLERVVAQRIESLRKRVRGLAKQKGGTHLLRSYIDDLVRTERPECLDSSGFPVASKQKIVDFLHLFNTSIRSYSGFLNELKPLIETVTALHKRPARILELASGSGGFALCLGKLVEDSGVRAHVTGSDIVPEYVEKSRSRASADGIDVDFIVLDAFDMSSIAHGAYDIVFIAQSIHHFRPGQMALMIRESMRIATTAFVGVDGYRSLKNILLVPLPALTTFFWPAVHDGFLSARKLYPEQELKTIAKIAAPDDNVTVASKFPGFTVLTIIKNKKKSGRVKKGEPAKPKST